MRVIWSTPPTTTTFQDPRNGRRYSGKVMAEVVLYEAGDNPSRVLGGKNIVLAPRVAAWRASIARGEPIQLLPPGTMPVSAVPIPHDIFAALPDDANVRVRWRFVPEGAL